MDVETVIINGLRLGDEKAYEYLYAFHYEMLCKVAYEYVNDVASAEMIVSDVIFSLWENRATLEINQSLRAYLVKSVRNRSLNYLSRQAKQINIDRTTEQLIDEKNQNGDAYPLSNLIEKELDVRINQCLDSLPQLTRKIFCLSRFKQLKYDEIATELNVSVDVVKYHIKSALTRLRAGLKDYFP
ncbi:MAG: RNA polymerase sigma-70 factor [Tannerellaceae bacterium]|jgi:RNA polymerase sigma-70 factor (ECF subfamily)|nr:RNA polymerase sigma-70 factor [Tannerellaceae bacterium]